MNLRVQLEHWRKAVQELVLLKSNHEMPALMQSVCFTRQYNSPVGDEFTGKTIFENRKTEYSWYEARRIGGVNGVLYNVKCITVSTHNDFVISNMYKRYEISVINARNGEVLFSKSDTISILRAKEEFQSMCREIYRDGKHTPFYYGRFIPSIEAPQQKPAHNQPRV